MKRYAELESLRRRQKLQALGRGYRVEDLAVLQSFGTASGYLSVLVLALYINSPEIEPLYLARRRSGCCACCCSTGSAVSG